MCTPECFSLPIEAALQRAAMPQRKRDAGTLPHPVEPEIKHTILSYAQLNYASAGVAQKTNGLKSATGELIRRNRIQRQSRIRTSTQEQSAILHNNMEGGFRVGAVILSGQCVHLGGRRCVLCRSTTPACRTAAARSTNTRCCARRVATGSGCCWSGWWSVRHENIRYRVSNRPRIHAADVAQHSNRNLALGISGQECPVARRGAGVAYLCIAAVFTYHQSTSIRDGVAVVEYAATVHGG
jgi:hypothetical protein